MTRRAAILVAAAAPFWISACSGGGVAASSAATTPETGSATEASSSTPRPATSKEEVSGPGKLLAEPIVYRNPAGKRRQGRPDFLVVFRVRAPFVKKGDAGETRPGKITVADSLMIYDQFRGPFGEGKPRGKCYSWEGIDTPEFSKLKEGDRAQYKFALSKTSKQTGKAIVHYYRSPAKLRRQLDAIGCPMPKESISEFGLYPRT